MKNRSTLQATVAALFVAGVGVFSTAASAQNNATIYGSQLMTKQERVEQRQRMQNAKTEQEREQIRAEHHERMQARAKERGLTLAQPNQGKGMGPGSRPGNRMRSGGGRS